MNKDFEKELKQLAKDQTPDLWSRIEAGVDKEMRIASLEKKRRARNVRFFTALAACVAALLLTIPVFRYVSGNKTGKNADTAPMDNTVLEMAEAETEEAGIDEEFAAPQTSVAETVAEEALPVETQEEVTVAEEPQTEDLSGKKEPGNSDAAGEPENSEENDKPDEPEEEAPGEDPQTEGIGSGDEPEITALTANGGSAYENISVTLSSIDANGYLLMSVVSDPAGKLATGTVIMLDVSTLVENTWTIGGNYVISFGEGQQTASGTVYAVTAANAVE